jgi:hypothetical protein
MVGTLPPDNSPAVKQGPDRAGGLRFFAGQGYAPSSYKVALTTFKGKKFFKDRLFPAKKNAAV